MSKGLWQEARHRQALLNHISALRIQDEGDLFQVIPLVTALKLWDLLREFSTLCAKKRDELQGPWAQTLTWIPHHRGVEKSASYWVFLKKWVSWNWGHYYLSHPKAPHTLHGVGVCALFPECSSSLSMRGEETDLAGFGPFCRTEHTAFRTAYSVWM